MYDILIILSQCTMCFKCGFIYFLCHINFGHMLDLVPETCNKISQSNTVTHIILGTIILNRFCVHP